MTTLTRQEFVIRSFCFKRKSVNVKLLLKKVLFTNLYHVKASYKKKKKTYIMFYTILHKFTSFQS